MEIDIQLTNEPIPATPSAGAQMFGEPASAGSPACLEASDRLKPGLQTYFSGAGAWVEFRGLVRGEENGSAIAALEYEAYPPMAEREMRRLITDISQARPCLAARVIHRIGVIPVGETAIYVGIAGRHRAEAFAMLAEFMDRLKVDVPIWKRRAIPAAPCRGDDNLLLQVKQKVVPPEPEVKRAASAEEVIALVRSVSQLLEEEKVELSSAVGRVLREEVKASEDSPAFDRSAVDGFAIGIDDPAQEFRIVDRLRAGDWRPRELAPGEAVQIATGGALPGCGLQVVMKENVRVVGDRVEVLRRDAGRFVRSRGEDCRAGDVLMPAGTQLSPGGVGLLASLGVVRPSVTRLPRVLHLATGNEIVPPDQTPARGQIRDSNSTLVRAFFEQWGIDPLQLRAGEDRVAIEAAIANSQLQMADTDVLLISGGASVGEHDFTRGLLESSGFTVHLSKTATRPGKPLIVAQRGRTVAFGLPGNPLAHYVCLNLIVRAALERMLGLPDRDLFETAVLAAPLEGDGNARETLWPAVVRVVNGRMAATPLRWSSSGDLTCLATANALLRVAPGTGLLLAGTEIPFATTLSLT